MRTATPFPADDTGSAVGTACGVSAFRAIRNPARAAVIALYTLVAAVALSRVYLMSTDLGQSRCITAGTVR